MRRDNAQLRYWLPHFTPVSPMTSTDSQTQDPQVTQLLKRAFDGDQQALGSLFQRFQDRLAKIVKFRMDTRIRGRLDPADVLQEAFIEATQRFEDYSESQDMPFFLWLRFITIQKLLQLHRRHLGTKGRDAGRDISIFASPNPQATSVVIAAHLLGRQTSPSMAAARAEMQMQVERGLNAMDPIDREVLALRHFEQLANVEVAELLDLSTTAASNRYIRAVKRLKQVMAEMHGSDNLAE